jgi:hypothetical protein
MKTKNRKWIGPVPITLVVVFALAAFLSAGLLLAPNGAQPAGAQDADCEIVYAEGGTIDVAATNATSTTSYTGNAGTCMTMGDTATIKVIGPGIAFTANEGDAPSAKFYIETDSGGLQAFAPGVEATWATAIGTTPARYESGGEPATPNRYLYRKVSIPPFAENEHGVEERQSTTFTVKKSKGGTVHIYDGMDIGIASPEDADNTPDASAIHGLSDVDGGLTITFLGVPVVGKDSPNDRNKIVDDFTQCILGPDGEVDEGTENAEGISEDCTISNNAIDDKVDDENDTAESLSKLDVADAEASVLDGKEATVTLTDGSAVTIRATIKDAENQPLKDVEVTFTATSVPAGIENRTRSYDSDSTGMADHIIQGLPTDKPYRVTVVVTAGEDNPLTVGTIVIARAGDLDTITAEACATVDAADDTKDDGCMTDYNPKMIYGPSTDDELSTFSIYAMAKDSQGTKVMPDSFIVKPATAATWWDALDCPMMNDAVMPMDDEPAVGSDDPMADPKSPYCAMYAGLSAEAMPVVMRAFGKAYGDATKAFNITATGTVPIDGMVPLTVKEDAPGAKYLLDVVASTGTGDKLITKSDQVKVIVSGELKEYMVDGPDYIALDGNATYTVTAMDENGNPPVFAMDENEVRILVQPSTVLVTNLDNDDLTLGTNTGMGEFTVFAPLGADDGAPGRIIVGSGTMQVIKNITFSMAMATTEMTPASTDLTAPTGVRADLFVGTSIIVTWDADSAQNTDLIIIALFNEGATALANIPNSTHPISLAAMDDPGAYSFSNVPSGTYEVAVASESDGVYEVSFAVEVVTVP